MTKEQLLDLYVDKKMTANEIAKITGQSRSNVYRLLDVHDIPRRQGSESKKQNINVEFFKAMSPELAYILGLWATDGYVKSCGIIGIKLIDEDVIRWIVDTIGYKNKVGTGFTETGKTYWELWFRNKEVELILDSYNITKRKTHTLQFPKLTNEMLSHFVRGLLDGDGAIFSGKTSNANRYTVSFTCASLEFITEFKRVVEGVIGGDRVIRSNPSRSAYLYSFSAKADVREFGRWLYQGNPFGMERKKSKFHMLAS